MLLGHIHFGKSPQKGLRAPLWNAKGPLSWKYRISAWRVGTNFPSVVSKRLLVGTTIITHEAANEYIKREITTNNQEDEF
jgi:hypothetical protein